MPPLITDNILHYRLRKQCGAVLLVMLVILVVGAAALMLNALNSTTTRLARDRITADALAQAKEALIGYAITYGDTNSNVNGFFPCPDQGQNLTQDGEAKSSCAVKNVSSIGKLPWKTLGLSPLKDGNGDCLWYAVSGTYKNNPDTDLMNWDNNGLFQIMAPDGVSFLAGSSADNQPVAIIFSPGPPIGTQIRTPAINTPSCGGNYTTTDYLDNDTIHVINNATVSAAANTVTKFISGQVKDLSGNQLVNDLLLIISRDDVFNAIKKRNDFGSFITTSVMNQAVSCLTGLPNPKTVDFSTMTESPGISQGTGVNQHITGRIPDTSCTGPSNNSVKKWSDNLAYAKCSSGLPCFSIYGLPCKGVIIFSGEKTATQNRIFNIQKNDWNNYLEGEALNIFTSGATSITGTIPPYNPATPSSDIAACIP